MRRARLLIYDGTEEWVEFMKSRDLKTPYTTPKGSIYSVDLIGDEITLFKHELANRLRMEKAGIPSGS